ncbi:MAG TPA: NAD-binding protein [Rectinemataceae bacterium]
MKVVIMGAGNLGVQIARELVAEKRDVVVIEKNPELAKGIANELDCLVCEGDGENPDVLEDSGVVDADWFIALSGSDETNIVSCGLVAETYSKPKTIARVRSHYFGSSKNKAKRILGVDRILNPEAETAEAVARIIFRGMNPDTIDVKEAGIQLRKIKVDEDPRLGGKDLKTLRAELGQDFIVAAVAKGGDLLIPAGDTRLESGDFVYFLGEPLALDRLFSTSSRHSIRMKSIVVFGANALARRVFVELGVPTQERSGLKRLRSKKEISALSILGNPTIKAIDKDKDEAKAAASMFPDAEIVCRDYSDELILEEENIGKADLVIGLTEYQSDNLALALLAKRAGAKRSLAVVHNDLYMRLVGDLGIDAVVNQKAVVAGTILDIVRKSNIRHLHSFAEGDFELVELILRTENLDWGSRIVDLNLPRGILVAFVLHDGETLIPTGSTVLRAGDVVGLILAKDRIPRLESLLGA